VLIRQALPLPALQGVTNTVSDKENLSATTPKDVRRTGAETAIG
jgi:hypothetical protein